MRLFFLIFGIIASLGTQKALGAAELTAEERKFKKAIADLPAENPYKSLVHAFLFPGTPYPEVEPQRGRRKETMAIKTRVIQACNRIFSSDASIFKNRSYFLKLLGYPEDIEEDGNIDDKRNLRREYRRPVVEAFDKAHSEFFHPQLKSSYDAMKLLINLDTKQDRRSQTEIARLIASIFENSHDALGRVKTMYLAELQEETLKVFINALKSDDIFFRSSTLLTRLLERHRGEPAFDRIFSKARGKIAEIRAKNASTFSLCLSAGSCCAWVVGGCLTLAYNTSGTIFSGSKVLDSSTTYLNGSSIINSTAVTEEKLLWDYKKVTSSTAQAGSVVVPFSMATIYGYKFLHDLSFRWAIPELSPALNWLVLYSMDRDRSDFIAGKLENEIQSQFLFFGRRKGGFVREIMKSVDEEMP